jgi:hypothetical protein
MVVRRVPPSLAISVGVHALIAVAWWLVDLEPPKPEEVVAGPRVELVEPEPRSEVEVVMLDAAALAQLTEPSRQVAVPSVAARPPLATRVTPKIAARAPVATPEVAVVTPPDSSPFLELRKGRDLEGRGRDALRISTPALERIARGEQAPRSVIDTTGANVIVGVKPGESPAAPPGDRIVTAEITPGGRGGYKIDDLAFTGRIEADGSVSIKDKSNLQHQFKSWSNIKKVLRESGPFGLLKVNFDITDAMMRRKKMDPYASRKLALLDQTRDARVELGTEYRKQVLARTSEIVRQNLEVAWAAVTDPVARKQALFEIWDEVDESGDEELLAAGTAARAVIVGFIRARIPSGSAGAFTAGELAAFNGKRKSRIAFAPYG